MRFSSLLLLLLLSCLPATARAATPGEVLADYIIESTDSLMKARLVLLDSSIMEHRLDDVVRRRIINYTENWPRTSTRLLSRSARYFPIFEEQLAAAGMPLGLKYVTIQESALRPFATSRVGAGGLWQLMPGTAREHGLIVTESLDERLDPELGCAAGLEYLQLQFNRYEDWSLALAAYNCGPGNVNKALRRTRSKKKDYWSIRKHLPRETRNYLPNIIAAAYLMAFHHEHDIAPAPMELDLQMTEAITVYRKLSLHRVIQVTGLRPDIVLELNAQYLRGYLPGMPGGHRLRLPKRVMPAMRTYLDLHPQSQAETAVLLPWTNPLLSDGDVATDGHYSQFKTFVDSRDTTLRQVAARHDLPVDQLLVWSNRGEFDTLSVDDEIFFFGISEYLPYDPRDRNTPPAALIVKMMPTPPIRIPVRKPSEWLPPISIPAPVEEVKKSGILNWFK